MRRLWRVMFADFTGKKLDAPDERPEHFFNLGIVVEMTIKYFLRFPHAALYFGMHHEQLVERPGWLEQPSSSFVGWCSLS
jgi:hypothetical protein